MRRVVLGIVLACAVTTIVAGAQSSSGIKDKASVCEIVNQPSKFLGKSIELRAQIWADAYRHDQYWLNEASVKFGTECHFLRARFTFPTDLNGQTAFGTFIGTVAIEPLNAEPKTLESRQQQLGPIFVIKQQADIHLRRMYLQGPVQRLQLFD